VNPHTATQAMRCSIYTGVGALSSATALQYQSTNSLNSMEPLLSASIIFSASTLSSMQGLTLVHV